MNLKDSNGLLVDGLEGQDAAFSEGQAANVDMLASMDSIRNAHYERNQYNPVLPFDQLGANGWTKYPDRVSIYHRNPPGCFNEKWGAPDGQGELVFTYNGDPVTDPANMGTYNFGTNLVTHTLFDVVPYWIWGNTPDDPTPFANRVGGPSGDGSGCACSAQ